MTRVALKVAKTVAKRVALMVAGDVHSGDWDFTKKLSFTRASEVYCINPITGVITSFGANVPATTLINGKKYLQVEASRQCLPTYNNQLTHANWSKFAAGDTLGITTDPVGGSTAYTYIPSTANSNHGIYQTKTCRTQALCAKANGYNYAWIRYAVSGVVTSAVICNLTTGALVEVIEAGGPTQVLFSRSQALAWGGYYFEITLAADSQYCEYGVSDTASSITFAGNGTDGAILWLPQASTATNYEGSLILTTSAAVTRAKDQAFIAAASVPVSLKDKCKVSFYPEWSSDQVTTGDERELVEFEDTTQNIRCYYDGADKKVKVAGRDKTLVSLSKIWGLAISGNYLYVTSYDGASSILGRTDKTGGSVTTLESFADGLSGLCTDDVNLYYMRYAGASAGLYSKPIAGGASVLLTNSVSQPHQTRYYNRKIYWADNGSGKIKSYDLDTTVVSDLITGMATPMGVAVYNDVIYYAGNGETTIKAIPVGGGTPTTIVSGLTTPRLIATDGTNIFWNRNTGTVRYQPIVGGDITDITTIGATGVDMICTRESLYLADYTNGVCKSIFKAPFSSAATTHSANQDLDVTFDIAGTVKLENFTTGNGTTTGTPWSRTDGILHVGQDASVSPANQIDGLIHLEVG